MQVVVELVVGVGVGGSGGSGGSRWLKRFAGEDSCLNY